MLLRNKANILFFLLILSTSVLAGSHYSFEHAAEMYASKRIDWRSYGPEAFEEAVQHNKPIFLLLTAPSWCYWCHVYTSDDYIYHPDIYPVINEEFIPIYVDADKRQDLTRQYLEGGWPSTTVIAPNRERLFGYSGPRPINNMLSNFQNAIEHVKNNARVSTLRVHNYKKTKVKIPTNSDLNNLINGFTIHILQSYDPEHGGFGTGQKFPQGRTLDFALDLYESTNDEQWINLVLNTLDNQYTKLSEIKTNYNLFDPVEGGFHRYGTQRDWTPPHYEKMLYDNVRLLKAYYHLKQLKPHDKVVKEVVDKTLNFIDQNWWSGDGFYGNSDVHGEDHYYGLANRSSDKPRVEKTKYSDWNSEAILTYLYLWQVSNNEEYKNMAVKSLDFFRDNIIAEQGTFHYFKEDRSKAIRGNLLDNSYLLLAFVEGYIILNDDSYLETAKKLADYSLDRLYDWNSGGFFERNSPDIEFYAPDDYVKLSKPTQENGVISYALLKLYQQTNKLSYLNSGVKTLGFIQDKIGGLDRGYYSVMAANFAVQNKLLEDYANKKTVIDEQDLEKQNSFWLGNLLSPNFKESTQGLNQLNNSLFLLMIIVFIAGLISFASPCTLPILPAYIAYTFKSSKHNLKLMTLAFFLGLSVVFSFLGMSASFIGGFLQSNITTFSKIAGIGIIFFGAYILFGKGFTGVKIKTNKPTNYSGSFLVGAGFGIAWTPCIGPILVAILLVASTVGSMLKGGLLLFTYGLGLALPLFILSVYLDKLNKNSKFWKFIEGRELKILGFKVHRNSLISGLLFILIGYLIFSQKLFIINQLLGSTGLYSYLFRVEEWLINFIK